MFNRDNDTWFKITNMLLIIVATISLGLGIGNNIYSEKNNYKFCGVSFTENAEKNNFIASCEYLNMTEEYDSFKNMSISYSIFGVTIVSLLIINISKKK